MCRMLVLVDTLFSLLQPRHPSRAMFKHNSSLCSNGLKSLFHVAGNGKSLSTRAIQGRHACTLQKQLLSRPHAPVIESNNAQILVYSHAWCCPNNCCLRVMICQNYFILYEGINRSKYVSSNMLLANIPAPPILLLNAALRWIWKYVFCAFLWHQ